MRRGCGSWWEHKAEETRQPYVNTLLNQIIRSSPEGCDSDDMSSNVPAIHEENMNLEEKMRVMTVSQNSVALEYCP